MKVAKAGASEALSRVGEKLRLGLDNITNQKVVETQSNNPYMQNVMEYGRRYNLGLSYKF